MKAQGRRPIFRIVLIIVILILAGIQFIRPDRSAPASDPDSDFLMLTAAGPEVSATIRAACYDCHSFETVYPWYAEVAPVSWLLSNHTREGREHVNFSLWGSYEQRKRSKILEECAEEISNGEMPMKPYTLLHAEAKLSDAQRKVLADWLISQGSSVE